MAKRVVEGLDVYREVVEGRMREVREELGEEWPRVVLGERDGNAGGGGSSAVGEGDTLALRKAVVGMAQRFVKGLEAGGGRHEKKAFKDLKAKMEEMRPRFDNEEAVDR